MYVKLYVSGLGLGLLIFVLSFLGRFRTQIQQKLSDWQQTDWLVQRLFIAQGSESAPFNFASFNLQLLFVYESSFSV